MELSEVITEDKFDEYTKYIDELQIKGIISHDENYELYNKAFEQVYGHSAFDENGNFYE